ncbi:MAG: hypothetical protein KIS66_13700 [Fimbriimonadaceae bacterium]|nr:hypothetical protein [Fimbriimonadaceae bacterium]
MRRPGESATEIARLYRSAYGSRAAERLETDARRQASATSKERLDRMVRALAILRIEDARRSG